MANIVDRSERIREITEQVRQAIAAGEAVAERSLIEAHAELMPERGDELRKLRPTVHTTDSTARADEDSAARETTDYGQQHGLHIRCPHCHQPIELIDENIAAELTCSTCGSSFNLAGEEGRTYKTPTLKRIAHFEIIEHLGMGAFGTVWKARDTKLDRTVAIKSPRQGQLDGEDAERFLREATAAAQLRHPNIVSVHEVGRQDDTIYIVNDFVRGVSLADMLTSQQLTIREAAELCQKIAAALHHAHEKGVIHRDLKPQNVMIDGDGEPCYPPRHSALFCASSRHLKSAPAGPGTCG